MKRLVHEKEKAITLRKQGCTYNEILAEVAVAKSSLSLWLKDLPLTKTEKQALKKRKKSNIEHGRAKVAGVLRSRRLQREREQYTEAQKIFNLYKNEPLFHAGIALYWAEGGKRTSQWQFMNSDFEMLKVMVTWLVKYIEIEKCHIRYRLYVHKAYQSENGIGWWADQLHVSPDQFLKTIIKPSGLGVKKRPNYHGCLRIEVRSSKSLLNQMRFWQKMIVEFYRKE